MHRLTLTDYLLAIIIVCALAFGLAYGLRSWLISTTERTLSKIQSTGY